jgi:cell division protein FtsN
MAPTPPISRPAVLAACIAALAAGCGGGTQPIRAETAARLQEDLDKVAAAIEAEECGRKVNAPLTRLQRDVGNLPDDVDPDVRQTLDDGIDRLTELAQEECDRIREERTDTTSTTTTTPDTTTTTTPTTTDTTTTEPDETTTEEEPPPDEQPTTTAPTTTPQEPGGGNGGTGDGTQPEEGG